MANRDDRDPASEPAGPAAPAPRPSFSRRIWTWFSAQGVLAKSVVTVLTAVVTALAVGVATRVAFTSRPARR
ncbi:MAG: hypothetical protein ACHQIG_03800 [Acidimicrobiia bacterium]